MKIISLLLFMICAPAFSKTESEVDFGSYTYHIMGSKDVFKKFENKVNKSGSLINNKMLYFKSVETKLDEYEATGFFSGENSMGSVMIGLAQSKGSLLGENLQVGGFYGIYIQDNSQFKKYKIQNALALYQDDIAIIPIFGIEVNFKLNITKHLFLKQNNNITPVLTNHSVGIGMDF